MGKKEEITDIFPTPEAIKKIKVGTVLKFDSGVQIKVTRKTKTRIWGEHVELLDMDTGMSHYGHNLDVTEEALQEYGVPYCQDCEIPVRNRATTTGDMKAMQREQEKEMQEELDEHRTSRDGK